MRLPKSSTTSPVGGVLILTSAPNRRTSPPSPDADRLISAFQSAGLAVLRVALPPAKAQGKAVEKKVRSSIESLSAQCGKAGDRLAVLAESEMADSAVLSVRAEWRVRAFVFLSGRLSKAAKAVLSEWGNDPTLCLVSSEDKPGLRDMADVYFATKHSDSNIHVFEDVGRGRAMLESWAKQFPQREPLEPMIASWLRHQLSSVGRAQEVSFMSEDGWKVFGNLRLPDRDGAKAPGAILLHSGRSDRYVFADLERLLVREGFAVLNIDWRGRGKTINKGRYFDLSKEERVNGKYDAKAAIHFLASQPGVDSNRIGLVGIVHGAEHAVRGSIGDPRVKALALLTGYIPISDEERSYLTGGQVQVMYVTCTGHRQVTDIMRKLYDATPGKLARFLLYEGGPIGYQLFEVDEKLEPTIVQWLKEGLTQ